MATTKTMKPVSENAKKWMQNPKFRAAYDALEPEYAIASAIIEARKKAKLSQKELAHRMGTTQPVIARMEAGRQPPSTKTLFNLAKATGTHLEIRFVE
ncbi:MAG: helix-turn-helix domain-containing protein [Bdellovibrionales bacterium]